MRQRTRRLLSAFVSLLLLLIAVWAIRKALAGHHPREIVRSIMEIPPSQVGWALLLIGVNFLLVAAMDTIAAHFAGKRVSYFRMLVPSFIGITIQYNAGFFGGSAMRYRLFSLLGLNAKQIAKMFLLFSLAFGVAFFLLTGVSLLLDPMEVSEHMAWWPKAMGVMLLAGCSMYFVLCARQKTLRIFHWKFTPPHLRASILQVLLGSIDWIVEAGILYVLLPHEARMSFPIFVSVFMLAHNLGVLSNTPGGLGVFEATILHLLPTEIPASKIFGLLLAYRGLYYVLPLLLAVPLLGEQTVAIRSFRHDSGEKKR
ncbi:hypothetical protein AUJ46_02605 [Candidatus Peregrinibacteria bacterium CG1_02_54_53]|nr:MAG: hypothetical protein AUJ46_02605 [Candidatus Peregrinibacteria bacterium CG1_02_54_53]